MWKFCHEERTVDQVQKISKILALHGHCAVHVLVPGELVYVWGTSPAAQLVKNPLTENKCTIELGFIFSDITTNFERISDHCSNIAVCLIEVNHNVYETHSYIDNIKHTSEEFKEKYSIFKEKYVLP